MSDGFSWWLVILGIAIGMAVVWLVIARLPRREDDIGDDELVDEAGWISRTINAYGGVAPQPLVEEVLELHRQYLVGPAPEPAPELAMPEEYAPGPTGLVEQADLPSYPDRYADHAGNVSPDQGRNDGAAAAVAATAPSDADAGGAAAEAGEGDTATTGGRARATVTDVGSLDTRATAAPAAGSSAGTGTDATGTPRAAAVEIADSTELGARTAGPPEPAWGAVRQGIGSNDKRGPAQDLDRGPGADLA